MTSLLLKRRKSSAKSTQGTLYLNGKFECHTLEDVVRPVKIKGETAIPAGTYKVIVNRSNRFKRLLPLLIDVPNFEGVRIHPGNKAEDTEGCILVGDTISTDFIGNSRIAFDRLFKKLEEADSIELTIEDAP